MPKMQIAIIPKTHSLENWIPLLQALLKQYPTGYILPVINPEAGTTRFTLIVDDHEMSHQDRKFLNSINRPTLTHQTPDISDEVYGEMRNRLWLMDGWYGFNNSIYDNH